MSITLDPWTLKHLTSGFQWVWFTLIGKCYVDLSSSDWISHKQDAKDVKFEFWQQEFQDPKVQMWSVEIDF